MQMFLRGTAIFEWVDVFFLAAFCSVSKQPFAKVGVDIAVWE